ncbi:unnamed protein product [Diatraea saccharalis]|uniref:Uncharacterized protein n=1 Tax=Diatraea saccharalis TaxID=40085 RepID=A0A9N9RE23_9NEOP|nr:unnamed protein product [Diatraea saccharalis]
MFRLNQKKTLSYLKELNKLPEVSVIGDYVKFVKLNISEDNELMDKDIELDDSEELSFMIDKAVDNFFNNHVMKFSALGKNISVPNTVEEFVGRKKRKGGGGGGHGGGDDGGKKKMMMMAMMCMKMKLMMMVPAMMGMMGMMSFKGMMFSMMSFMIAKMMLLMKILEKKGGGGGGGGGGDGGWPAGGGGGAWMPAGSDYAGGGSGGGYDANGQWQSRSMIEEAQTPDLIRPTITYVTPIRYTKNKKVLEGGQPKSRSKRGIVDVLQYAYTYWLNRIIGGTINRRKKQPNYKYVNGVKYVYYPIKMLQKIKQHKEPPIKSVDEFKPMNVVDDFNKGEIVDGPIESRMNKKKLMKMKDAVNENVEENPWE